MKNKEKLNEKQEKKTLKALNKKEKTPFYKKNSFKYSTLSSVIIVVFIVCLVAVNILASFLSDRFTAFSFDMTSSSDYTISDKNKDYIEKIDKDVTILVTCTEEYYTGDYYSTVAQYYTDNTNGKYFAQTVELLKNYEKINPNITVEFVDSTTPDFDVYKERYQGNDISIGDIVVDYTYETDDKKEKSKYKILTFDDLYQVEEASSDYTASSSSYGALSGSNVETQITSALYYVINEQSDKIAVITGYGSTDASSYLSELEISGYDYEEITDLQVDDIPEDCTMVMLTAPTIDLSQSDIKKLDTFLLGDASGDTDYGKSLIYFASSTQFDTPNLDNYLEEWGIQYSEGTVYETNDNYHSSNSNTSILMEDAETEYSADMNSNLLYYCDNNRPMTLKFESSGKFNTYGVVNSYESCVTQPLKASSSWDANAENPSSYTTVALSRYTTEDPDDETKIRFSNVLALSSIDFISENVTSISSVGNDELMLSLMNTCAGRVAETYEIDSKTINYTTFSPTEVQANTIFIVCSFVIPILSIATGIVLFVRRKRR